MLNCCVQLRKVKGYNNFCKQRQAPSNLTKDNIAQLSPLTLQKPLVMKEAYTFSDKANEFSTPLGTNQCSLNKVIGTFLSVPDSNREYYEIAIKLTHGVLVSWD